MEQDLVKGLKDEVIQVFSQATNDDLKVSFERVEQILTEAIDQLTQAKEEKEQKQKISYKDLTPLMKQTYTTIMKIRTSLLGDKSAIKYRLYMRTGSNLNTVKVVEIPEEQLMNYVERNGVDLRLKKWTHEALQLESNRKIEEEISKHIENIQNSLKLISNNNYVVPFNKVRDIFNSRVGVDNLYWQTIGERGKSKYSPKMFNRGWIYQALDATIADKNYGKPEFNFRETYFKEYLKYDNLKGFKGGDVGLYQIKSNGAQLISIITLINYLKNIKKIVESLKNKEKVEDIKNLIKQYFMDADQPINNELEEYIDNQVKLLLQH